MERNAILLDSLDPIFQSSIMSFVIEAKVNFAQEIERERQWETREDRDRDERFE